MAAAELAEVFAVIGALHKGPPITWYYTLNNSTRTRPDLALTAGKKLKVSADEELRSNVEG